MHVEVALDVLADDMMFGAVPDESAVIKANEMDHGTILLVKGKSMESSR